jgi:hypothetical protein
MKRSDWFWGCAVLLAVHGSAARADVTIEMRQDGKPLVTYVSQHKLASSSEAGGMIFLADEKVLRLIDAGRKRYTEMTAADAAALGEQMAAMQQRVQNMPPQIRERMPGMANMPGAGGKRTVRALGETRKIRDFDATGYVVTTEGTKGETEVWTTDPQNLGIQSVDFAVFRELAAFMRTMVPGLEVMREMIKNYEQPGPGEVPGFPVLTIRRDENGGERSRTELIKCDRGSIPGDKFKVPAGFKKQDMDLGEGGAPGEEE